MEENQHHLYIACEASKGNLVVPKFWLGKLIHLFLPERFPNI